MIIKFDEIREAFIPNLNGGEGMTSAKIFTDGNGKVMISRLPKGSSIGAHEHTTSYEINYVISGTGISVCNGEEEPLSAGSCCICPLNSVHSIENTGDCDLELFTVVAEK